MLNIDLSKKRALVCGASQGIGKQIAINLAQAGADVTVLARRKNKIEELISQLPASGNHQSLCLDLMDQKSVQDLFSDIASSGTHFDILIFNSQGPKGGPILETTPKELDSFIQSHLYSQIQITQLFLEKMKENHFGRIINITSTSVKSPIANLGASNILRAAVANYVKTLSLEVASFGITVNNILPGYTQTPRLEALIAAAGERQSKTKEEIIEEWKQRVPAQRFAKPHEPAYLATFLASDLASYINGASIPVDGGRTACI